jgi:hypothetical protein
VGGDGIKVRTGDQSTVLSYGAAMPGRYVALLRAVNVGGTGALAMSGLDRERRGKRSPDPAPRCGVARRDRESVLSAVG